MRQISYLNTAVTILKAYNGSQPFSSYIKEYFRQHKKHGSKDRRSISHLCFCYFRIGKLLADQPVEKRVITGLFLCSNEGNELLATLAPEWNELLATLLPEGNEHLPSLPLEWNEKSSFMLKAKMSFLSVSYENMFPFQSELSSGIDWQKFAVSHLVQPDLFIRIRPGHVQDVVRKLREHAIPFAELADNCLALDNTTKLEGILTINKEVVIQDRSSQAIGMMMKLKDTASEVWDCCCASGGKSIMAVDVMGDIRLTVSDVRPAILSKLKQRFIEADITNYKSFVADLSQSTPKIPISFFDLIIADVPCTGSGTWSRTPEQLYYFSENRVQYYQTLQSSIVAHVVPALKRGGHLLYITCSVFAAENEEVIAQLTHQHSLEVIRQELFIGYDKKADTLFASLLRKR